jgi:putative transposase
MEAAGWRGWTAGMLRRQGYQFEAMPSGEQLRQLRGFGGSCRFVYNQALALNQQRYEAKEKRLGYADLWALLPQWKLAHPWLADTPSQALQQSLKDLERAYTNFFEKRAAFPDFHKKGRKDSLRIPQGFEVDNQNGRIKLPKIGWMRYRKSRDIAGQPKNVTVSMAGGKVFVSIQTEREVERVMHPSRSAVGIDWGVVRLATLSDGEVVDRCAPLQQHAKRLARLQRRLARKKKFSNNWKKGKAKISKLHQHIANVRKDFVHKASDRISKSHVVVVVEDLQVKNLSKSAKKNVKAKSGLNRAILDASPFELRRQLEYKALWRGGLLIAVPPQNTSRSCPNCGHVSAENRKRQAKFVCVKCGFSANADFVAACNIREAGLALLACSYPSGDVSPSWQLTHRGIPA